MMTTKERAVDIINRMPEDKAYYVLQILKGIEELTRGDSESDETSGKRSGERKLGPLAGRLIYMADDFDETPDCFKDYV